MSRNEMGTSSAAEGVFSIEDLQPMLQNPRRHTARNIGMLARSIQEHGAARGIVVDENFQVLAGNGVLDAAVDVGVDRVRVIEADGEELVVVQVRHMTEAQKRRYALADNRVADLSGWDADELRAMLDDGISLDMFWSGEELEAELSRSAFAPTLEPEADWESVTEADVERMQRKQDGRFEGETGMMKQLAEHTCPNCGRTVYTKE